MAKCQSCGTEVPNTSRFCGGCGRPVAAVEQATDTVALSSERPVSSDRPASKLRSSSSGSLNEGRFLPGTLLIGRYRIIALVGRGGMGEVYRADDLTLEQPVALKFLPEAAAQNPQALQRFRSEVRIARRVSHPNVCRVYDVGEVEGHTFLSMEYVDGEDLGILLRRIGRLPADKALEISRKLCAGLAAAHEKGVLHRDLKPGNVMLDSRGEIVITDFGLAGLVEDVQGAEARNGTPAYMSPEQLAGKEISIKSDIYALGLLLYEIFTGKRPFEAETLAELVRARTEMTPTSLSTLVRDLDPAVERVILRCLDPDPSKRPASALAVAVALRDPLAAALAAGETPSPQLVAASGETTGLAPRVAIPCLAAAIAGLIVFVLIASRLSGLDKLHLENSPEILSRKAQELARSFGYTAKPADRAQSLYFSGSYLNYIEKHGKPQGGWDQVFSGRPSPFRFWYREGLEPMVANDFRDNALTPGVVTESDPPLTESGMLVVEVDGQGRLTYFNAIPPELDESPKPAQGFDWNTLFSAAGLDPGQFKSTEPTWTSLAAFDERAAWQGVWPGTTLPLRVEAAAWRGKPVFFKLIGPWTEPSRVPPREKTMGEKVGAAILISLFVLLIAGGGFLARRNYVRGRGDRRGAFRLALAIFLLEIALWVFRSHHIAGIGDVGLGVLAVSTALFLSGATWMVYLALEPYVRRHWPQTLISWTRLLAGQIRDPLVGRDVLLGVLLAIVWILAFQVLFFVAQRSGGPPQLPASEYLAGTRSTLSVWLMRIPGTVQATLGFFFLLFVLRVVLRKQWLASAGFAVVFTLMSTLGNPHMEIVMPTMLVVYLIAAVVVWRFGLLPLATGIFVTDLAVNIPMPLDPSTWYFADTLFVLLSVVALAVWGFHTSLAGQSLWKSELFE